MRALPPRHSHPASLPGFGQRRPSLELSSDDASLVLPAGRRNFVLPWSNGPVLYVSSETLRLHPDAHSGCKRGKIRGSQSRLTCSFIFVCNNRLKGVNVTCLFSLFVIFCMYVPGVENCCLAYVITGHHHTKSFIFQ